MEQTVICNSAKETEEFAAQLASTLTPNSVLAFTGDLGAGKTTFTRGLCAGLGYTGEVSSPTFAIVHEYIGGRIPLYHFDMYRVDSVDDLYACGFYDYLDFGILAIEWSENISSAIPKDAIYIHMQYGENENQRIITVSREDPLC